MNDYGRPFVLFVAVTLAWLVNPAAGVLATAVAIGLVPTDRRLFRRAA